MALDEEVLRFAADAQRASQLMTEEMGLAVYLQLQGTFEGRAHHEVESFARFQAQFAEITKLVPIVRVNAADDIIAADCHFGQRIVDDARHHTIGAGNRLAMRAALGEAAHFIHFVN